MFDQHFSAADTAKILVGWLKDYYPEFNAPEDLLNEALVSTGHVSMEDGMYKTLDIYVHPKYADRRDVQVISYENRQHIRSAYIDISPDDYDLSDMVQIKPQLDIYLSKLSVASVTVLSTESSITDDEQVQKTFRSDVFVVMPFSTDFQAIYDDYIVPTVQNLHLSVKRGDDFFSNDAIIGDINAAIRGCRLVIADCTGQNPNVFYEIGVAHTLNKPVIMIAQQEDEIPFDVAHLRRIKYQNSLAGSRKLKTALDKAIRDVLQIK